jgi:hypothetical protein
MLGDIQWLCTIRLSSLEANMASSECDINVVQTKWQLLAIVHTHKRDSNHGTVYGSRNRTILSWHHSP